MLRALCVARHPFLSDHLRRVFGAYGLSATAAVGMDGALAASRDGAFDVVVCDYDLLAVIPIEAWETDALLSRIPVIAVSMTREPDEVHLLDVNNIAGFLYLPRLDAETAMRVLAGCRPATTPYSLPTPFAARPLLPA